MQELNLALNIEILRAWEEEWDVCNPLILKRSVLINVS